MNTIKMMGKRESRKMVAGFLGTVQGLSYQEAVANLHADARDYGYHYEVVSEARIKLAEMVRQGVLR